MIDLHMHTKYSDGVLTVEEILLEAQRKALQWISITDHNTVAAYHWMKERDVSRLFRGGVVAGVEVNCVYRGSRIELLGYDFEDVALLDDWLKLHFSQEREIAFRTREYDELLSRMQANHVKHNCPAAYDPNGKLPHTVVYHAVKAYEQNRSFLSPQEWDNFSTFFRTATVDQNSPFFIDYSQMLPCAGDVSSAIRESGGKVFLAHVYSYPVVDHLGFVDGLVKDNIVDGIETYYAAFTQEQTEQLLGYCCKKGLLLSGGSDFHGHEARIELGTGLGSLHVPDEILQDWHLANPVVKCF